MLDTLNCKILHSDNRGELIETSQIDDGDAVARFVKVVDPSTGRKYVLRVPPKSRTASEGVAWTFGFDNEADYQPEMES